MSAYFFFKNTYPKSVFSLVEPKSSVLVPPDQRKFSHFLSVLHPQQF